jgi:PAS domain S-box-containing protein
MAEIRSRSVRVLIVDDSPTDRVVFRRHLTRGAHREYDVSEAETAAEAAALLAKELPDCVLVDFHLPEMDGLNFVRQIVEVHGNHTFGIVMLTSAAEISIAVKALQNGAHDYLEKNGADGFALRRAVENAMEKAGIQRQLESQRRALADKNAQLEEHVSQLEREATDRQRAEDALRSSETQLRLVTDHASVLLAQVDREHRYKFVNRAYAERYGREVKDVIGRHVTEIVGEKAYLTALPELTAAFEGQRVEFEKELPYEELGPRWIHVVYKAELGADGQVVGVVAVLTDLTERKRAEQELKVARDQALAASGAKDEFLARLSHELRTPLNPVLLLASEAAANPDLPDEVRADFHTIRKNVDLEARLIDDLLDITRISRGKLSLELRRLDVHDVLRDAFTSIKGEADKKHLRLQLSLDGEGPYVLGDAVRLQQIFWNLLNNAVKFTPENGRIVVSTYVKEGWVTVEVQDDGIGLSEEELSSVFDAFAQGEHSWPNGSHRFGGLGLGLAISRMLVEMHSGKITAFSEGRNAGATFRVQIPLQADAGRIAHAPTSPRARPLTAPAALAANGKCPPLHILIVEDHEPTRAALTVLMTRRGHRITNVACVEEARQAAACHTFDLMISDIGLPDGNGYDLMEELHAQYGIRAIALTGYGMEQDISRSTSVGFLAHLTKPVRIQELEAVISRHAVPPAE